MMKLLCVHVTAARSVVLMFMVSEKFVWKARLLQRGGIKRLGGDTRNHSFSLGADISATRTNERP